ncbi:uncharacterized protein LOC143031690 isoform X2 [Oratosquilla oratoria]|uniref:uncharacterized protein LOC143031690 isoform X2 n=1 Tax=Oratosquilla oratoria TaxID=337810 RepID=UPI003F75D68C
MVKKTVELFHKQHTKQGQKGRKTRTKQLHVFWHSCKQSDHRSSGGQLRKHRTASGRPGRSGSYRFCPLHPKSVKVRSVKSRMECSICITPFGEHRRPLALPCGHSFCRQCIIQVHSDRDYVVCPKCQAHHTGMEVSDFPINYELEDLLENLKVMGEGDSPSLLNNGTVLRAKDDICPDCRSIIDLWCDSCHVLICEECTMHGHCNRNHHVVGAKDAIFKLQRSYLEKMEKIDSILIKNTVVTKELAWAATSLVEKLNKSIAEIEDHRTQMLSQKMHIQSGLSLGELSKIIEGSQFDISCPSAMQEIKEAQVMSDSMEMLVKNFQALQTQISQTQTSSGSQDASSVCTLLGPAEGGAAGAAVEVASQDNVITTYAGSVPHVLMEAPHDFYVNVPEEQSIPYYATFELTILSEDCNFTIAFAAHHARYAMFHFAVDMKARTADLQTTHPVVDNSIDFSSNNFPFCVQEPFTLTVRECADKFIVKHNGHFLAFCRKYGQARSISRCATIFIEGKSVLLREFKVLRG